MRKSNDNSTTQSDKGLAIWEIASVITSCLIAEWVVLAFAGSSKLILALPVVLAIGLMLISHRERGETLKDVGFRLDNVLSASRILVWPTVAAILILLVTSYLLRSTHPIPSWRNRFFLLPLWALFQQYVLNGFINRRAQIVFGCGMASVSTVAIAFCLLHLPNPLLSLLTLIGGFVWGSAYQKEPNLLVLAVSHSLLSITVALTISPDLINSLRVGFKFFG